MKTCLMCKAEKPLSAFYIKVNGSPRPYCKACMCTENRQWVAANKAQVAETKRRWVAANPGAKAANARKLYKESGAMRERITEWRKANPDKVRQYTKAWNDDNKSLKAGYTAKRRAAQLQRTPAWADLHAIEAVYEEAAFMRSIGVDAHVDHIVPLRGNLVSGLHTHNNLQILLATDNLAKGRKFIVSV